MRIAEAQKAQMATFAKFVVVGTLGFVVDYGGLRVFMLTGLSPFAGRALSIPIAMLFTWSLNRSWSFGRSTLPWYRELAHYVLVGGAVALVNYASFTIILYFMAGATPFLATAAACIIALVFSFAGYGKFVFER